MEKIVPITDHLFISSYRAAKKQKKMKKAGITAVVNLMEDNRYEPPEGVDYLFKSLKDKTYIPPEDLEEIFGFIREQIKEGKVLVHCHSGLSRSAGIVIGQVLIDHPDWTWEQARKYVREFRTVSPHPNIKRAVLDYLEQKEGKRRE